MTPDIAALVPFLASVVRESDGEHVPGVFVQGPDAPCILTCLHAFDKDPSFNVPGKRYNAVLQVPLEPVTCVVIDSDMDHDFLVLQLVNIVNRVTAPVDLLVSDSYVGSPYILIGRSTCTSIDAAGRWQYTWNACRGFVTTSLLNGHRIGGGGGSAPGDSGGPIFHGVSGQLIGINVSVSLLHPGPHGVITALPRASPEGRFVPLWIIELVLKYKWSKPFFGHGGVLATYDSTPPSTMECGTSSLVSGSVPHSPFEMLCGTQSSPLAELFDPVLLDPYRY